MDWPSLWVGLGLGILASAIAGVVLMWTIKYLSDPKLRLRVVNEAIVADRIKSLVVDVKNDRCSLLALRGEAKRVSILYLVTPIEKPSLHLTWFFGQWINGKNLVDIGPGGHRPMVVATKSAGNTNCFLMGKEFSCSLRPGEYDLEWQMYLDGSLVGVGRLLLTNPEVDMGRFLMESKPMKRKEQSQNPLTKRRFESMLRKVFSPLPKKQEKESTQESEETSE